MFFTQNNKDNSIIHTNKVAYILKTTKKTKKNQVQNSPVNVYNTKMKTCRRKSQQHRKNAFSKLNALLGENDQRFKKWNRPKFFLKIKRKPHWTATPEILDMIEWVITEKRAKQIPHWTASKKTLSAINFSPYNT